MAAQLTWDEATNDFMRRVIRDLRYEKVRVVNAIKENHKYYENVSLEDNVRGIAIDLDDALKREAQKDVEIERLRDLLNEAHAERDNALDNVAGVHAALSELLKWEATGYVNSLSGADVDAA